MSRRRHINSAGSAPGRRSAAHRSCDDAPIAPRHETAKRIVSACSKNTVYHMTWASRCGALFIDGESSGPAFSHGWFPTRPAENCCVVRSRITYFCTEPLQHSVIVMKIEPATMAHVAGIRALYDAMAGEDAVAFPRVDDHAFYMMDDLRCSNPQFVAVAPTAIQIDDGGHARNDVVGWAIARRHQARGPVAQLGIAIAAPWRRKGVGTAVLDAVICEARRSGIHSIQLTVLKANKAAIALYSKFGFAREFDVDEDWAFMQRSLHQRSQEPADNVVRGGPVVAADRHLIGRV
jgi:RimJ/RimL family protein N-acetyltransferase